MRNFLRRVDFWNSRPDPFTAVRSGWTKKDFETRSDLTVALYLDLPTEGRVLDLGCGLGYACKVIAPKVESYVGLDWASTLLEQAADLNARWGSNMTWRQCTGDGDIPFPDAHFAAAISEQMFIHIPRRVAEKYFRELQRVVRGQLVLEIPKSGEYVNGWSEEELVEIFPGIEFIERESVCWYVKVKT